MFGYQDKEEVTSPGNETDSNSTNTTPKTMISNESSIKQGSPTPSLSSEISTGPSERPPRLARSVTPVPVAPLSPSLQKQPSVGNVLARTSSFGSSSNSDLNRSGSGSSLVQRQSSGGSTVTRQSSQGSIFEQFTSQARELVRETTRQSSQDGLLAHMDKVRVCNVTFSNLFLFFYF